MPAPVYTINFATPIASRTIAASSSYTSSTIDASAVFEIQVQISTLGQTAISATNGCQLDVYCVTGNSANVDTISTTSVVLPTASTSTTAYLTVKLPPGKYQFKLTNLDATNAITASALASAVSAIA